MTRPLSLERFRELALAYGGTLGRWPSAEREAARALSLESPEARALLVVEETLDRALASSEKPPEPSPDLWRRLNEIPVRAPQRRAYWPFQRAWIPALSWALAAVIGVGWGFESAPFDVMELDAETSVASIGSATTDSVAVDEDIDPLVYGSLSELEETP